MTLRNEEERYLPALFEGITENLKIKAHEELNESDEKITEGLKKLKTLIKGWRHHRFLNTSLRPKRNPKWPNLLEYHSVTTRSSTQGSYRLRLHLYG
ncbi:hypothetical protein NPIL_146921 [Nephila pilipes]|uniref:Uncharacterized protein n=1 Tax=Nephila pilipes TaxID=299642 RepID=A0A8X6MXH1_NEPPI|nr:hypothetical protein NPIL_146921 [Nephila pilipes]